MFNDELSLSRKLRALGEGNIFEGTTHYEDRRERARAFINKIGCDVIYTVRDGKRISLGKQFELVYGEVL